MASSRGRAGENFGVWQGAWLDIRPWPDKISSIVFAHFSTPDMSMGGMGGTLVLRSHSKFQVIQGLIREDSLFLGWGGATSSGNPYNSRESPYLRKRFFTCPFILPKDSKKSKVENFSPPLRDALKIFRPPLRDALKNFRPPPST